MMYPYHNKIKQRIRNGELVDRYFTESYPGIGEALVLVFNTAPFKRPIRPHRWPEYVDILADWARQKGGDENALYAGRTGRDGGG